MKARSCVLATARATHTGAAWRGGSFSLQALGKRKRSNACLTFHDIAAYGGTGPPRDYQKILTLVDLQERDPLRVLRQYASRLEVYFDTSLRS